MPILGKSRLRGRWQDCMNDFKKVLKEIKPSTRAWFEVARNYAMFANDGGTYDDLLEYLRTNRLL